MNQFNRIFRILWSKTKEQWVVTSELEGPGGKKQGKGLVSVFCTALVAAGMLTTAPEDAQAITGCSTATTFVVATPITGNCTLTAADSLTVSSTGVINGTGTKAAVRADFNQTSVTVNNSGSINGAGVSAIFLDLLSGTGSITNLAGGLIQSTGATPKLNAVHIASAAWNPTASAVQGGDLLLGSQMNNSGTIDRYANINKQSTVVSIAAIGGGGALAGTLNNTSTGVISATLNMAGPLVNSAATLAVRGLDFSNRGVSGVLNNAGSISVTLQKSISVNASSSSTNIADGINHGVLTGSLTNDGSIVASMTNSGNKSGSSLSATVRGIAGSFGAGGVLTNNGSVSASASNSGNVTASNEVRFNVTAINIGNSASGSLVNSSTGSIIATVDNTGGGNTSAGNFMTARGIASLIRSPDFGGSIRNSGSITATATATHSGVGAGNNPQATGILINHLGATGVIDNYGTITASASATGNTGTSNGFSANGILLSGRLALRGGMRTGSVVNNYGTISASTSGLGGKAFALHSPDPIGSGGTINNFKGGVIKGNIRMNDITVNLNNAGLIELPAASVPAVLTNSRIYGAYTQQAGGVLRIEAINTASYGWITVGSAVINAATAVVGSTGTIDVNVAAGSTLVPGNQLTGVVWASTSVTIPIAGMSVTDNSGTIDFTAALSPNGNAIDLTVIAATGADTQIPVISLVGNQSVTVGLNQVYTDAGVTALDNVDGDISANVTVTGLVDTTVAGIYTLTYDVSDAAGNAAATVSRQVNVIVDVIPPVITLNGNASLSVVQNTTYTDAGATALDNIDGDVSANIATGGTFVNTSTPGTYTMTYNVSDAAGNAAAQLTRDITVTAAAAAPSTPAGVSKTSNLPCITPTVSTGLLPMLATMLVGLGVMRRRKK